MREESAKNLDALIGRKAARHPEVFRGLVELAETLPRQEFELFCQFVPSGITLWERFTEAALMSDEPAFGWEEFVRHVFKKRKLDLLTPPDCKATKEQKRRYITAASGQLMKLGTSAIIQQHLGDVEAISQVTRHVCTNCTQTTCPRWFGWNSFPKGVSS